MFEESCELREATLGEGNANMAHYGLAASCFMIRVQYRSRHDDQDTSSPTPGKSSFA